MRIPAALFILASTCIHAQDWEKESDLSHAILTFTNGTQAEGEAKLSDEFSILFKEKADSTAKEIKYEEIAELYIKLEKRHRRLVPKAVEGGTGQDSLRLLEIVITGKISLFKIQRSGSPSVSPIPVVNGYPGFAVPVGYSKTTYFISRGDNDYVTPMRTANTRSPLFRSIANRYFYDCPSLLKKIKGKDFEKGEVQNVVGYYNDNCQG